LKSDRDLTLRLDLVGAPSTAGDREYEASLMRRARRLGIDRLVKFHGPVPFHRVPTYYQGGGLFLNLSTGALDKAILESMAAGCIPISRNPAFAAIARAHGLDWLVPNAGPDGLAECLSDVLERTRQDRATLAARLRRIVTEEHSLSGLSDRIAHQLTALAHSSTEPPRRAPDQGVR
jgi:glycosyltransferase involved in cell wall biosynthesis